MDQLVALLLRLIEGRGWTRLAGPGLGRKRVGDKDGYAGGMASVACHQRRMLPCFMCL
jgi:hypothetical protein